MRPDRSSIYFGGVPNPDAGSSSGGAPIAATTDNAYRSGETKSLDRRGLSLAHFDSGRVQVADAVPALARTHSVVTVDLQGHGRTADLPERPMTIQENARDVIVLLRHLGISEADLLGESYGGATAILIALYCPDLVGRIATYGATFFQERVNVCHADVTCSGVAHWRSLSQGGRIASPPPPRSKSIPACDILRQWLFPWWARELRDRRERARTGGRSADGLVTDMGGWSTPR